MRLKGWSYMAFSEDKKAEQLGTSAPKPRRFWQRRSLQIGVGVVLLALILTGTVVIPPRTAPPFQSNDSSAASPVAKPVAGFVAARSGYYDTVWPSEHADLWRSHAAFNAGLPANFSPNTLRVTSVALDLPTWGYTRNVDEVFVSGGSPFALNTFTQAIKDGQATSGLRSLQNVVGDILDSSVPYVANINPLTMQKRVTYLRRGITVNYTGGLLIHQNGFVYAIAQSVLYKINPVNMHIDASVGLPLIGNTWPTQYWTTYNGMQVLASGELVLKGFDLRDSATVPGYLLLINPDTLTFDVRQSAMVSSARLTLQQNGDGTAELYHVNAVDSLRYHVTMRGFQLDSTWTRNYRTVNDGNTQASSPLLFGQIGQVAFANNTAPGAKTPIQLYTQNVQTNNSGPLLAQPAFTQSQASFNFFMVAGDPFQRQLVVYYDPLHNLLSAHQVMADGTLPLVWEHDGYKVSASPAIVVDRNQLYIDDYHDGHDWLVVLELSTGKQLAAIQLTAQLPTIGTIFPGMDNDVYVLSTEAGTTHGLLSRITVP